MKKRIACWFCLVLACPSLFAQHTLPNPADKLRSGPMPGFAEMTETVVWLQTTAPTRVQLRFWKRGKPETSRLSREIVTREDGDFIARIPLADLDFGTVHDYEVYFDGVRLEFPYPTSFHTKPMWRFRGDPPDFKFAFGSCAYFNDEPFDRPKEHYGRELGIFQSIAGKKPDFMLWLGDNVYYREADFLTERAMRYRWGRDRGTPELQSLLAATHHYALWDDHDFGPNDGDRSFRDKAVALKVFRDYWANPTYGTPEIPGVFGRFEWGDAEFFLLDDRYHRSPNLSPDGPDKVMFGAPQLKWLMDGLRSSEATFKIVVGGNQMMNMAHQFEGFAKFPAEMKTLLDFIRDARVRGVLFLSGDRHHTELVKRVEAGLYPLYDFTSSPLTSSAGVHEGEENNPLRIPGTWVTEAQNFGMIEVTGKAEDRKLTLLTFDKNGKELWRHEIKASELTFPPPPPPRQPKGKR